MNDCDGHVIGLTVVKVLNKARIIYLHQFQYTKTLQIIILIVIGFF